MAITIAGQGDGRRERGTVDGGYFVLYQTDHS